MNNDRKFYFIVVLLVILMFSLIAPFSAFAETYPSKAIELIVPYGPGGGGDIAARRLATTMAENLGVPVVVKNLPGAGGISGFTTLWRSKADGYTIGMYYAQIACTTKILSKVQYDPMKFEVIGQFALNNSILAVPKDSPYKFVSDFKTADKKVRFCVINKTSNRTVAGLALAEEMKIPLSLVTGYKSGASTILGIMKGEGDFVIYGSALKRYIDSGDVVPLMQLTDNASALLPDVPTLKDSGLPSYLGKLSDLSYVLWAPPGTSKEKIEKLQEAMQKSVIANEQWFKDNFYLPNYVAGADFKKELADIYDYFSKYKDIVLKYER